MVDSQQILVVFYYNSGNLPYNLTLKWIYNLRIILVCELSISSLLSPSRFLLQSCPLTYSHWIPQIRHSFRWRRSLLSFNRSNISLFLSSSSLISPSICSVWLRSFTAVLCGADLGSRCSAWTIIRSTIWQMRISKEAFLAAFKFAKDSLPCQFQALLFK